MLLNNFKTLINSRIMNGNNDLSYTTMANIVSNNGGSNVSYTTGTSNYSINYTTPSTSDYLWSTNTPQLIVGTGTTTPTLADYKLANYIYVPTTSGTQTNSNAHLITVQTFQNTGSSSVTINEVGLIVSGNNNDYPQVLLTRSVLTTPVTIDARASRTFTVDIDINKFVDNTNNS